jgi:hypothetical protein
MRYFSKLRERRSSFYNLLWDELESANFINIHEHLAPPDTCKAMIKKIGTMLSHVIEVSDIYHLSVKKALSQNFRKGTIEKVQGIFKSNPILSSSINILPFIWVDDLNGQVLEIQSNIYRRVKGINKRIVING